MYILAFETSCDDTSVALMKDDILISMSTRTQLEHDITGGVVPEVAARSHANAIFPCIEDVMRESDLTLDQVDVFACTEKPGLLPSLLTGMTVAKMLSLSYKKPLLLIDHIESHVFANFLERKRQDITFPAVILTVSGGHTELYHWRSLFELECVGRTRDDAAGEAFDKVSKMMGLGFPGGAKIAQLAEKHRQSNPGLSVNSRRLLPEVLLEEVSLDFSFSGIKTAVKREIDKEIGEKGVLSPDFQEYIAFEFEEVTTNILLKKLLRAQEQKGVEVICLAGGVSANSRLKEKIELAAYEKGLTFLSPKKSIYSMDNAAMVGIRAYYELGK